LHVSRLYPTYALTDGGSVVEVDHLRAAIALWDFSARCVNHIFGGTTGDLIADRVLQELALGPLTRWEIHDQVFCRNVGSLQLEQAGRLLERRGLIVRERVSTGGRGRPPERWRLG
jgi:hypothetical protein